MKTLTSAETLDLIKSHSIEEFMVKKDLLKRGPFNQRDSYLIVAIFCAQRREEFAWKLYGKKLFTIGQWFVRKNDIEKRGRQKYINDAMQKFCQIYIDTLPPS